MWSKFLALKINFFVKTGNKMRNQFDYRNFSPNGQCLLTKLATKSKKQGVWSKYQPKQPMFVTKKG